MVVQAKTHREYLRIRLQTIYDRLGNKASPQWNTEDAEAARTVFLKYKRLQSADSEMAEVVAYLEKRLPSLRKHLREKKAIYWSGRDAAAVQAVLRKLNHFEDAQR